MNYSKNTLMIMVTESRSRGKILYGQSRYSALTGMVFWHMLYTMVAWKKLHSEKAACCTLLPIFILKLLFCFATVILCAIKYISFIDLLVFTITSWPDICSVSINKNMSKRALYKIYRYFTRKLHLTSIFTRRCLTSLMCFLTGVEILCFVNVRECNIAY